jgi:hypothetical protein
MRHDIGAYGVGISIVFAFVRWAVPVMPKPIAWAGVVAGIVIVLVDLFMPDFKLTIPAIALFLIGMVCIGGAVHLAMKPKQNADAGIDQPSPSGNQMGTVKNNRGIVTQDQKGDNAINSK